MDTINSTEQDINASPHIEFSDWINYDSTSGYNSPRIESTDSISASFIQHSPYVSSPQLTSAGLRAWQRVQTVPDATESAQGSQTDTQAKSTVTEPEDSAEDDLFTIYSSSNYETELMGDIESISSSVRVPDIPAEMNAKSAQDLKEALSGDISFQIKNNAAIHDLKSDCAQSHRNSSWNKNLRILDNLLLLTSQYIDDSPQSIYLIFPYLLRKIVEVCDSSTTWKWADIYFRSLLRLVEKSRENNTMRSSSISKSRPSSANSRHSSRSSSLPQNIDSTCLDSETLEKSHMPSFSFISPGPPPFPKKTTFKFSNDANHRNNGIFHSYRTLFLISLTSYLACKMADFSPTHEPEMVEVFLCHIIPTLAELSASQRDVCDAPGIALMYIFGRVDISIQDLLFESNYTFLYSDEEGDEGMDDCQKTFHKAKNRSIFHRVSSAASMNSRFSKKSTIQLIHPKEETLCEENLEGSTQHSFSEPDSGKSQFMAKFLEIIWIRLLAMGYYRRLWARQANGTFSSSNLKDNSPLLSEPLNNVGNCDTTDLDLAVRDKSFMGVYKRLVVEKYCEETDVNIKELYVHFFGIRKTCEKQAPTPASSAGFDNNPSLLKEEVAVYEDYEMHVKPYSARKISATLVELLRLLQNSLCRLIPRHVHLKLLMMSLFNVPSTAPPLSSGSFSPGSSSVSLLASSLALRAKHVRRKRRVFGEKRFCRKQSTVGRTLFTIKQAFASSNKQSVLDRFAFYMPETIWEDGFD